MDFKKKLAQLIKKYAAKDKWVALHFWATSVVYSGHRWRPYLVSLDSSL
jgi:hypothetical protein